MLNKRLKENYSLPFVGDMIGKTGDYVGKLERGEVTINEMHQMILTKDLWASYSEYQVDSAKLYFDQGREKINLHV